MKELSIEEKARRYDEVLAMAKECITYVPDEAVNKYMLDMFPELKERRIRKAIYKCVEWFGFDSCFFKDVSQKECLAWLEEQKRDGKNEDVYLKEKEQVFQDGIDEVIANPQKYGLEKQGEQKVVTWHDVSEEPEIYVELLCECKSDYRTWHNVAFYNAVSKSFEYGICQKVENVTRWCYIADLVDKQGQKETNSYCKDNCKGYQETGKCYADGDCEAKRKAEQNLVCNEEDERIRKALIDFFNKGAENGEQTNGVCDKDILAWLEKQGEHANFRNKIQIGDKVTRNEGGVLVNISQLNRIAKKRKMQGEKNPADNVEPKFKVGDIISNGISEVEIVSIDKNNYNVTNSEIENDANICNWVVYFKDQDNWKLIEQIPTDNVEPKFHEGNWYQCTKDFFGKGVTFDKNTAYYCAKEGCLQDEYGCHIAIVKDLYDNFKLWTIEDAKDGDVLVTPNYIYIFNSIDKETDTVCYYCLLKKSDKSFSFGNINIHDEIFNSVLATEEQRNLLFAKMKEAGYEWDDKNKELKKIEQKPAWSDNDEEMLCKALYFLDAGYNHFKCTDGIPECKDWLKSIKDRVQPMPRQEWSKEDENNILFLTSIIEECFKDKEKITLCGDTACANFTKEDVIDRLKSLKDRVQPKQEWSEEDDQYLLVCKNALAKYQVSDKWDATIISRWLEDKLKSSISQSTWNPSYEDKLRAEQAITYLSKKLSFESEKDDYNFREGQIKWLKSIKDRVQPKVELTQLDKNILEAAIAFVEQNNHFNCWCGVDKHTVLSALRSLRPQNTWKPSEQQMKALNLIIIAGHITYAGQGPELTDLYKSLKKLKEE